MKKVHNFSAGPCILPKSVLKEASEALINFEDTGLSLIEMSHRSKNVVGVMDKAQSLVRELLNVPDNYDVLFLQGGASLGFYTAALNFLSENGKAYYINTGTWANNALKESKHVGNTIELASSKEDGFKHIPKGFEIPADGDYLHITTNNTIFGTQFQEIPKSPIPIIADMSSDIFSRPVNVSDYAMIYAGAQKNMGPAGTTLYIVNRDLLGKTGRTIPSILDYSVHAAKDSMFNTPPVFAFYVSMLTLQWLKDLGGVPAMEKINAEKAATIYAEIDRNPMFKGYTAVEDRSKMNATFNLSDDSQQALFDEIWKAAGISGINGHRSVGGYRASMYNALPLESVQALVDAMKEFEAKASVNA